MIITLKDSKVKKGKALMLEDILKDFYLYQSFGDKHVKECKLHERLQGNGFINSMLDDAVRLVKAYGIDMRNYKETLTDKIIDEIKFTTLGLLRSKKEIYDIILRTLDKMYNTYLSELPYKNIKIRFNIKEIEVDVRKAVDTYDVFINVDDMRIMEYFSKSMQWIGFDFDENLGIMNISFEKLVYSFDIERYIADNTNIDLAIALFMIRNNNYTPVISSSLPSNRQSYVEDRLCDMMESDYDTYVMVNNMYETLQSRFKKARRSLIYNGLFASTFMFLCVYSMTVNTGYSKGIISALTCVFVNAVAIYVGLKMIFDSGYEYGIESRCRSMTM